MERWEVCQQSRKFPIFNSIWSSSQHKREKEEEEEQKKLSCRNAIEYSNDPFSVD